MTPALLTAPRRLLAAALLAAGAASGHAQTAATWNGGTGNWSAAALWTPAAVPNSASADVSLDGGRTGTASTVNVDGNYTVGRLTIDTGDSLNINNAQSLTVTSAGGFAGSGALVNNGTFTLVSTGSLSTDLVFNGTTSLSGTGTLNLQGAAQVRGTGTLTISSTVQGETSANTSLGGGSLGLNVAAGGLVNANNAAGLALVVRPGSPGVTNAGTLRASGGGTLVLNGISGTAFTNTGAGVIEALNGSQVQLTVGATVSGGTLSTAGTGMIRNVGTATLGSLTNNGAFTADNGTTTTLAAGATLLNRGRITLASTDSSTDLVLAGDASLSGSGALVLQNAARVRSGAPAGTTPTLTNAAGHSIVGSGEIGSGTLAVTNQGSINANSNGRSLVIAPANVANAFVNAATGEVAASRGGSVTLSGAIGTVTNNGTFSVSGPGRLGVAAGALTNFSGTTLTGGSYVAGSSLSDGAATLSLGGGNIVTNNAQVALLGNAVFTEINALANNQGRFELANRQNFTTVGNLTNSGIIRVDTSTLTVSGTLTNSGSVRLELASAAQLSQIVVQGAFNHAGLLSVDTRGSFSATGAFSASTASQVIGRGKITAPTLSINGAVRPGDYVSSLFGDNPVRSSGLLTLEGQVNFSASSTFVFELGVGTASDQIQVNGSLTLDGTLSLNALAGFGTGRYDLINYTGTLTNNTLEFGTVPAGYNYAIDLSTPGQVNLVVTNAVPEPGTWALLGLGTVAAGTVVLRRRRVIEDR